MLHVCLGVLAYLSTDKLEIWPLQMQFAGDSPDDKFKRVLPDADPGMKPLPDATPMHLVLDYDATGVYPELPLDFGCSCKAEQVMYRGQRRWAIIPDRDCTHNHLSAPSLLRKWWECWADARRHNATRDSERHWSEDDWTPKTGQAASSGVKWGPTVMEPNQGAKVRDTDKKVSVPIVDSNMPTYDDSKYAGPLALPHYMHKEERSKLSLPETIGAIMATVARVVVPTLANADMGDVSNRNALVDWCSRNFATYEQRAALYAKHMQAFTGGRWGQWTPADIGNAYHFCVAYCSVPTNGKIAATTAEQSKVAKDRRSLAPNKAKGK
jgi:hypothetical protein